MNALSAIAQGYSLGTKTADTDYIGFDGVFKSDARSEEKETGKSTIANFYVEDGSQVSDHIIRDAKQLTISGEVSDVFYQKNLLTNSFSQATDALGDISIYLPTTTSSQVSKVNEYVNTSKNAKRRLDDFNQRYNRFGEYIGVATGNDTLKTLSNTETSSSKSTQAEFVAFIREYQHLGRLMKIETIRFGTFEDMAISSYSFSKNEDDYMSYTIDFQQIRKTKTIVTPIKLIAKNATGKQAGIQTSDKQDKGVVQGKDKGSATSNPSLLIKLGKATGLIK